MSRHYAKLFAALLTAALMQVTLIGSGVAGTEDDAQQAYKKGDYATALRLYRQLAEQGDIRAQNTLARMYEKGEGTPKDTAEAAKWFRRATDEAGAWVAYNRRDFVTAMRIYRPLAEKWTGARAVPCRSDVCQRPERA